MQEALSARGLVADHYGLTTRDFAAQHLVLPQTVRKQYSATGSYFGVIPLRLPNRKLLWPCNAVHKLLAAQDLPKGDA